MTFDGNTIGDYSISHGFVPGSYSETVTTTRTTILESLSSPLDYRNDTLVGVIGQDYIHRFQQADSTKLIGGEKDKDPILSILGGARDTWKKSYLYSCDIVSNKAGLSDIAREGLITTANMVIQEGGNSHSLALGDRQRTEGDTQREALQVHKTSEAVYERQHREDMQDDRQTWETSEALLDKAAETTLQDDGQTERSATSVDKRSAESTRNLKQLNADYSSQDLAYPGLAEFWLSGVASTQLQGWLWTPRSCNFLELLYNRIFYRGLHPTTLDDWYDTGEM